MCPVARLVQLELGAPGYHFLAKGDESADDVAQAQNFGAAAANSQHVGRERALRRRVAPQLVQHHLGRGVALQLDDHAHAEPAGFVADVGDALDPLVLRGLGDLLYQAVLAHLIRDGGEHDGAPVSAPLLDLVAGTHDDAATPGHVGRPRPGCA